MLTDESQNGAANVSENVVNVYTYHPEVLNGLSTHGLMPRQDTPPQQLRDAVRDLYRYEIRVLRDRLIAGEFPKHDYAGLVVALRRRYWLLSVPLQLWTSEPLSVVRDAGCDDRDP